MVHQPACSRFTAGSTDTCSAVFLPFLIEAPGDFKQRCHINFLFSVSEGVTLLHFLPPRQKRFTFWERKICCQSVFEKLSESPDAAAESSRRPWPFTEEWRVIYGGREKVGLECANVQRSQKPAE